MDSGGYFQRNSHVGPSLRDGQRDKVAPVLTSLGEARLHEADHQTTARMKFPHFFIERPIFATVLSVIIVLVGGITYFSLPVSQYPNVAPPTIVVRTSYPGREP